MSARELLALAALAAGVYVVSRIAAGPGPAGPGAPAPGRRQKSERSRRIEKRIGKPRVMPAPQPKKKYYWYMGKRISDEELEKLRRSHMEYQRRLHEYSMYKRFYEGPVGSIVSYPGLDLRLRSYPARLRIAEVMREIQGMRGRPMIRYVDANNDGFAECIRFEIYDQELTRKIDERLVCA